MIVVLIIAFIYCIGRYTLLLMETVDLKHASGELSLLRRLLELWYARVIYVSDRRSQTVALCYWGRPLTIIYEMQTGFPLHILSRTGDCTKEVTSSHCFEL